MTVSMGENEENKEKTLTKGPSVKYGHFMRVSMDRNDLAPVLKIRTRMRASIDKNEGNEKETSSKCPMVDPVRSTTL